MLISWLRQVMTNFEESSTNAGTDILSIAKIVGFVESLVAAMGRMGSLREKALIPCQKKKKKERIRNRERNYWWEIVD